MHQSKALNEMIKYMLFLKMFSVITDPKKKIKICKRSKSAEVTEPGRAAEAFFTFE
jgi:hypothetical protein